MKTEYFFNVRPLYGANFQQAFIYSFIHSLRNSTHYFTFNIVQKSTANQYQGLTSCVQASSVKSEQIVSEEIKENEMQCKKLCSLLRARAAGGSQSLEDSKCVFRG